mmetsp:Transcript_26494/g.44450  ORF Transcript_26494/g.44450 Transcript_26494/m.44450 type:complete len:182 (+) Transcript_26494:553-1098(+)
MPTEMDTTKSTQDVMNVGHTPAVAESKESPSCGFDEKSPWIRVGCSVNSVPNMCGGLNCLLIPCSGIFCGCPVFHIQIPYMNNKLPNPNKEPILGCCSCEDIDEYNCPTCWVPSPVSLPCCLLCFVPVAILSVCSDKFEAGPCCYFCFFAGVLPSSKSCCYLPCALMDQLPNKWISMKDEW